MRETREEVGLSVHETAVCWGRLYQHKGHAFWFFVAHLPEEVASEIRLGDEGQRYELIAPHDYLTRHKAIPQFQQRLADYLASQSP